MATIEEYLSQLTTSLENACTYDYSSHTKELLPWLRENASKIVDCADPDGIINKLADFGQLYPILNLHILRPNVYFISLQIIEKCAENIHKICDSNNLVRRTRRSCEINTYEWKTFFDQIEHKTISSELICTAISDNQFNVAKWLLKNRNIHDSNIAHVLDCIAGRLGDRELYEKIQKDYGREDEKCTLDAFLAAVKSNNIETLRWLLKEKKFDLQQHKSYFRHPTYYICNSYFDSLRCKHPLEIAISNRNVEMCKFLFEHNSAIIVDDTCHPSFYTIARVHECITNYPNQKQQIIKLISNEFTSNPQLRPTTKDIYDFCETGDVLYLEAYVELFGKSFFQQSVYDFNHLLTTILAKGCIKDEAFLSLFLENLMPDDYDDRNLRDLMLSQLFKLNYWSLCENVLSYCPRSIILKHASENDFDALRFIHYKSPLQRGIIQKIIDEKVASGLISSKEFFDYELYSQERFSCNC